MKITKVNTTAGQRTQQSPEGQRRSQPHRARPSHQETEMAQKQSQRHPWLLPPPQKTIMSNGGTVGA